MRLEVGQEMVLAPRSEAYNYCEGLVLENISFSIGTLISVQLGTCREGCCLQKVVLQPELGP